MTAPKRSAANDWRTSTRAGQPDADGYIQRDGVGIFYEVFGTGEPTILMLPTWSALHAAHGRFQVADLSRHYRVVTFDGRGNGLSDRPRGASAYDDREFVADALAVLDATGTDRAVVIACSQASHWLLRLAADHPDRVLGAVASGTNLPLAPGHSLPAEKVSFHEHYRSTEGWAKFNADYWREHYEEFLRFFFSQVWTEPHSEKVIDDCVSWGLETTPETLIDTVDGDPTTKAEAVELAGRIQCPMLVVHGGDDAVTPLERSVRLAHQTGGRLVILEGAGHCSGNRDPVKFNLLVREFVDSILPRRPQTTRWTRGASRVRRVLFVPSGSGLGTARRDVAIADALRGLRPGLLVEWLATSPTRELLEERGEAIHPASDALANEAAHLEREAGEHELDRFSAIRRMDEVLFRNFMIFNDVAAQEHLDLVIADGAWQVDHHLHENPELKRFAYAWLTDVIGWLPMREGGDREAGLVADANTEMLQQVARYPRIRDRALYLGDPADLPAASFGAGLPPIREWARNHFSFTGAVAGFEPADLADQASLRNELGYRREEQVCIVTAGGTTMGEALLRRAIEAFPIARLRLPALRMVVVAGPRLDPAALPQSDGLEVRGYVPGLHRHLAASDVAVVHGGQATTMELLAARRPFIWFPLKRDFEQRCHVTHRLRRYRADRPMEYGAASAEALAHAIVDGVGREMSFRPVAQDGAATTMA